MDGAPAEGTAEALPECLTDVPAALAPAVVIPHIEGFDRAVSARNPATEAGAPKASSDASALSDSDKKKPEAEGRTSHNGRCTAEGQHAGRPARRVPPPGAFSLRSTLAVLSQSPPSAMKAGKEVEAAGWEAAAYPYDGTLERDAELDRVIDGLVRDLGAEAALSVHRVVEAGTEPPQRGVPEGADEPDDAGRPAPFSATSSTATALPPPSTTHAEGIHTDYTTYAAEPVNAGGDIRPVSDEFAGEAGCAEAGSPEQQPRPTAHTPPQRSGRAGEDSESSGSGVDRLLCVSSQESPGMSHWQAIGPAAHQLREDGDDDDDGPGTVKAVNDLTGDGRADGREANPAHELRESSPVAAVNEGIRRGKQRRLHRRQEKRRLPVNVPPAAAEEQRRPVRVASSTRTSPYASRQRDAPSHSEGAVAQGTAGTANDSTNAAGPDVVRGHRKGSYADPTACWARRLSAPSDSARQAEEEEQKAPAVAYPKTEEGTTLVGEFHLATAERTAAAEARRQALEAHRRQQAEQQEELAKKQQRPNKDAVRRHGAAAKPKGFDAIAEEGRRKRQQLEEKERQRRLEDEGNLTFRPKISQHAMRRGQLGASNTAADAAETPEKRRVTTEDVEVFIAASKEWEEKREHNLELVQRRLQEEEETERNNRFVNERSERLLKRKKASERDGPVYERLTQEAGQWRERKKALEEKYTPSFQPETNRGSSTSPEKPSETAGGAPAAVTPSREREKVSLSFFTDLYERTVQRKAELEAELERRRAEELATQSLAANTNAGKQKRSKAEIAAHIEQMVARDAERRLKFEQKVLQEKAAEEEAAAQRGAAARIDPHSAQIAFRGRERLKMREEQQRRAREWAQQQQRKEEEAAAAKSANRTPAKLSSSFEAHEMRSEERRAQNLGRLRQQLLEEEMAACTFKPTVCPASEELANRSRYSQLQEETAITTEGGVLDFSSFQNTRDVPQSSLSLSASLERARRPVVQHPLSGSTSPSALVDGAQQQQSQHRHSLHDEPGEVQREESREDEEGLRVSSVSSLHGGNGASPAPRLPLQQQRRRGCATEEGEGHGGEALSGSRLAPRSTASLEQEIENLEQVLQQWKLMEAQATS